MLFLLVALLVVALCLALVVAVARDPGPPPGEVALAYELAWDRLDFDALWSMSAAELRERRSKREFVAAKRTAYRPRPELGGLVRGVTLEDVTAGPELAEVLTRVELRDGAIVRNRVGLVRRDGSWQVVAYELRPDTPARS